MGILSLIKQRGHNSNGPFETNPEENGYKCYKSGQDCVCGDLIKPTFQNCIYICKCQALCHKICILQQLQQLTAGKKRVISCPKCNYNINLTYRQQRKLKVECRMGYVLLIVVSLIILAVSLGFLISDVVSLLQQVEPLQLGDIMVLFVLVLAMSGACVIGYFGVYGVVYKRQFFVQSVEAVQNSISEFNVDDQIQKSSQSLDAQKTFHLGVSMINSCLANDLQQVTAKSAGS